MLGWKDKVICEGKKIIKKRKEPSLCKCQGISNRHKIKILVYFHIQKTSSSRTSSLYKKHFEAYTYCSEFLIYGENMFDTSYSFLFSLVCLIMGNAFYLYFYDDIRRVKAMAFKMPHFIYSVLWWEQQMDYYLRKMIFLWHLFLKRTMVT